MNEKQMMQNAPTEPGLTIEAVTGDMAPKLQEWIALVNAYDRFSNNDFIHWFFGPMTKE